MAEQLSFEVVAGPHPRRFCPVSALVPPAVERPSLSRDGRAKPVACQLERTPEGSRLWWLVDLLVANGFRRYRIGEDRQRLSRPRVTIQSSAVGLAVAVRRAPFAELLLNEEGPPRLTLRQDRERLAALTPRTGPTPLHRRRRGEPQIVEGPVFGAVRVVYDYIDALDRSLGAEAHHFRFYDGPAQALSLDWTIEATATTGPIALAGPQAAGFRLDASFPQSMRLAVGPGWTGAAEINGRPAAQVLAIGAETVVALFARSDGFGFPPHWTYREPGLVEGALNLGDADEELRLALGETFTVRFRLALFPAKNSRRLAAHRYLDFDCPPTVRRES